MANLKKEWIKKFEIVKEAIDEFNLYDLLPDVPSDEFDNESRKIAGRVSVNSTVEEIAMVICEVFSSAFNQNFKIMDFMITADKICKSLKDNEESN